MRGFGIPLERFNFETFESSNRQKRNEEDTKQHKKRAFFNYPELTI